MLYFLSFYVVQKQYVIFLPYIQLNYIQFQDTFYNLLIYNRENGTPAILVRGFWADNPVLHCHIQAWCPIVCITYHWIIKKYFLKLSFRGGKTTYCYFKIPSQSKTLYPPSSCLALGWTCKHCKVARVVVVEQQYYM